MELWDLPAHRLQQLLTAGDLTSRELTEIMLQRLYQVEPLVGAFITTTPDLALQQAQDQGFRQTHCFFFRIAYTCRA